MSYKELTNKTEKELNEMLKEERNYLRELRFKIGANQLKDVREVREARLRVSRILTRLREIKKAAK